VPRRAGTHGFLVALALLALACSPELDWRELRSEEGRFVAVLPGKPQLEEHELSGRPGAVMHLWSARARGAVYGVGYVDQGAPDPALIERTRDALVANIGGRVIEDREIAAGAARGREFRAEGPDAVLLARVLVAGRRQYQVAVVGKKGSIDPAGVDTFFSSFRVVPEPPAK
jgi:hypothetical protein